MTADIAIALALVALVTAGYSVRTVLAWRQAHDRLGRALLDTSSRLAALTRQLNEALGRLRLETRITLALGDLAASSDLADVLTRVAGAAASATGARAAVARATAADGTPVVGSTEESTGLPLTTALEWPADGARAMTFTLLRGTETPSGTPAGVPAGPQITSGLAVPIVAPPGEPVGQIVALFDGPEPATAVELGELERLAARAAPIVLAARGARAGTTAVTRDPLTGLATRQVFHESLAREVARAHRHTTPLALLLLDVDDFRALNEQAGRREADAALVLLAASIEAAAPPGSVTCRIGGDEFAVILPGSNRLDVEVVLSHVRAEHRDRARGSDGTGVTLSSGVAELMPRDDALRLYDRADRALRGVRAPEPEDAAATAHDADEQG